MFENNGHIREYKPRTGADNPLWSKVFQNYKSGKFAARFSQLITLLQVFPFKSTGDQI